MVGSCGEIIGFCVCCRALTHAGGFAKAKGLIRRGYARIMGYVLVIFYAINSCWKILLFQWEIRKYVHNKFVIKFYLF